MQVEPEAAGERLDTWLAGVLGTRAAAARAIDRGEVAVDGANRPKGFRLRGGELVVVTPSEPEPEPDVPPATFDVVYEDDELLVVNKPAGVVVHPGAGNRHGTLVQALAGRVAGGEDPDRPGVVHRLDRDTTGLLVLARSDQALAALQSALRRREITREYLALVHGRPTAKTATIDAPLGRDRRVRTRMSTQTDEPREAITHFTVEEPLATTTLLRVTLETGRTHQIRAHLQAIGHPVCGDPEYGGRRGELGLERQFLHAQRLVFAHPISGLTVDVTAALPDDLSTALQAARAAE